MVLHPADLTDNLSDPRALRDAYGSFPSGVVAVCRLHDDAPIGLAASSFVSVSIEPPLVSVCVRNESQTWPLVRGGASVGVSLLASHQHAHGRALAGPAEYRFTGLEWHSAHSGAVFLDGAAAWLECVIDQEVPAGDHHIVVLRIVTLATDPGVEPLVFHASRFRSLHP
jgi:flavin reductase (DIM6/NTAB) family NADH-FMN oxidoreductase RutF